MKTSDNSGNDITANPIVKTSYGYTNRELDVESGMMYYRARYYMPEIGRFISEDPDPGTYGLPISINSKYLYTGNNPLLYTDPSGEEFFTAVLLFTLAQSIIKSAFKGGSFFENLEKQFREPFTGNDDEGGFYSDLILNSIAFYVGGVPTDVQALSALGLEGYRTLLKSQQEEFGYGHKILGGITARDGLNVLSGLEVVGGLRNLNKNGLDYSNKVYQYSQRYKRYTPSFIDNFIESYF